MRARATARARAEIFFRAKEWERALVFLSLETRLEQVNGHILMLVYNVFIEDFRGTVVTVRFIICSSTASLFCLVIGMNVE